MEQPDADAVRVSLGELKEFAEQSAVGMGIPAAQAEVLADLLVENDLRGVFSHGSRLLGRYLREIESGRLNPVPEVTVHRETRQSVLVDGDGGLGYFPALEGTRRIIEMAKQQGMAAMVTRNHGHIGAAGIYTRMAAQEDLLAFMTSGVQLDLKPGDEIYHAAGQSPMSFCAPAAAGPPLIFDCGVTHDLQGRQPPPHRDEVARLTPGIVLRAIGFGTICQAWGGLLTGMPARAEDAPRQYSAAHQGAMMFAFQIELFADVVEFKQQVTEYVELVRQMKPIPGTEGAFLPGGVEAEREQRYRSEGIPIGPGHRRELEDVSGNTGVALPWGA